jgi:hypothetical protein
MNLQKLVPGLSMFALLLLIYGNSYGRCAPSVAYRTSFKVLSCEDRDPNNRSKLLGYGAILEVNVLSKKEMDNSRGYQWWPINDPLPKKLKVFYDKPGVSCSSVNFGEKRSGTMRSLCCDGAEPRCNFDTSVALYD